MYENILKPDKFKLLKLRSNLSTYLIHRHEGDLQIPAQQPS